VTEASPAVAEPSAADFDESPLVKVRRLERMLADQQKFSVRATKQMHATLVKELKEAEQRARRADKRAEAAEKRLGAAQLRAKQAEAELSAIKQSSTWKAGRAIVGVPARIKRLRRS